MGKGNGGVCKYIGNGNETAEYVGTAFMARDILRVAEAVDKDGLIRFWGKKTTNGYEQREMSLI
jgi:hypothetical protein